MEIEPDESGSLNKDSICLMLNEAAAQHIVIKCQTVQIHNYIGQMAVGDGETLNYEPLNKKHIYEQ